MAGPFIVFLIASFLTPLFNYWVSKPEVVYEEQISGLMPDNQAKNPLLAAVELNEYPYHLTGVAKKEEKQDDRKPGLDIALLDDNKFVGFKTDNPQ